jgi:hypothetical protein
MEVMAFEIRPVGYLFDVVPQSLLLATSTLQAASIVVCLQPSACFPKCLLHWVLPVQAVAGIFSNTSPA